LLLENRVVGVMALFAKRPLAEATLTALGSVADGIALGIERKRAEESLRETHAQLSHLLEYSPAVIYALRVEGQKVVPYVVSENITEFLGFRMQETLHYEWWLGQVHPEDRDRAIASVSETLAQGSSLTEYRLRHQDGSYRWVEDKRRLVRGSSNQPEEIVGIWSDITERKRAEEVLRQNSGDETHRGKKTRAVKDAVVVLGFGALVFLLASLFNLFERPLEFVLKHKETPLDEFFGTLLVLSPLLAFFAYRRWKDVKVVVIEDQGTGEEPRPVSPDGARRTQTGAVIDTVALLGIGVLVFGLGFYFNLFERPLEWVWNNRDTAVDELFGTLIALSPAFMLFGYRRWRETRLEVIQHQRTANALRVLHGELDKRVQRRTAELVTANKALNAEIDERKRAEEGLRRSEGRSREMLENLELIAMTLDTSGVVTFCNDYLLRLTGWKREEIIGADWFETFIPETDTGTRQLFFATIEAGTIPLHRENPIKTRTGELRQIVWNNTMLRDAGGNITGTASIGEDVTGRKQAEEGLRDSEEKFRQLAENIHEVFWITNPLKNQMLYISPAYERIWGRTCSSLYQSPQDWAEAIHPEDRERVLRAATTKQASGEYDENYRITRPDGAVRWIHDRAFPIRNTGGEVYRVVGTAEDITRRKQVEHRLAMHHAVTQVLSEAATLKEAAGKTLKVVGQQLGWDVGGFWAADRSTKRLGCVEIWHPPSTEFNEFVAFSRGASFAPGECLPGRVFESGRPAWLADVSQDDNLSRKPLAIRIGLRSAIAFPIRLRGETLGVIEFFSAHIQPPDDELLAMFGTIGTQIGEFVERKQLEGRFLQSQKMEAFGQLAGGVAHDFNNILAVIMGYTSLTMEQEGLNDEVKEEMKQVYSAGERAANLTRQLLTFSRKKEMEVNALDLNGVIGNLAKMLGRIIGENIKLQCNYVSNLPTVQADEGMIEQVLMNLAVNARDAMVGGGQLTIGTERVVMDAHCVLANPEARAGEFVCVSVRDTGCGMTPEIKARIFEPFFTTKDVGKGTGLGLATVYGIVKQHQGWLEVESQVGAGTTFKVFLPASVRLAAAAEQAAGEAKARGGNETILLVEDEPALRTLGRAVLQRHGYRVLEASSGVEALEVWERNHGRVDLLLTDMVMPEGMTGRELAKQLKERKPELKVIYTSGYSLDSTATSFRLREVKSFLQKPYHPQKLIKLVRETLDADVS
ncbi:MAG TPA: PAS domain S-box protein, partial [Candidatus Angelobacter sp.]|nr:PAS domain S-box protein [Candidatus Angelobacter sp.]